MKYLHSLGRIAYKLAGWVLWTLPIKTKRCRGIIIAEGDILLVRNWFSDQRWSLPGGGIHKGEKPASALIREIKEELSIKITKPLPVGQINQRSAGLIHRLDIFLVKLARKPVVKKQNFEIIDHCWFPVDLLPRDLSPSVRPALRLCYKTRQTPRV